jgi:hypothetical protein
MITTRVVGGENSNITKVTAEGAIHVVQHPHPPSEGDINYPLPIAEFFKDVNNSNNMIVNASLSAPQTFKVSSVKDFDVYIKSITIQISDQGARLDKFGALPALTNGVGLSYNNQSLGIIDIFTGFKSNLDFFREATGGKGFGDSTNAWLADISGGGQDTYFPEIDLQTRYGLQWGFKLAKGTQDSLLFKVQDDLTGLGVFNIKAHGFIVREG